MEKHPTHSTSPYSTTVEIWYMDSGFVRIMGCLLWIYIFSFSSFPSAPQLDADNYENDPELEKIQIERKYSWMDTITTDNDQLPHCKGTDLWLFYQEHRPSADALNILNGSGYFDIQDEDDQWIWIFMENRDVIMLPAGIYHQFIPDENVCTLDFPLGNPVWKIPTAVSAVIATVESLIYLAPVT
uniref:acireductone dioxygenase (Fe(2+)-requiring) n=1 Tax=Crocodylus porosus TaxID=8502 RepID=A0A7M4EML8_CROPO